MTTIPTKPSGIILHRAGLSAYPPSVDHASWSPNVTARLVQALLAYLDEQHAAGSGEANRCKHGVWSDERCVYCVAESSNDPVGSPVWPPATPETGERAERWADFQPPPLREQPSFDAALAKLKAMTPEEVFESSVRAGIHNPDGTLTERYRDPLEVTPETGDVPAPGSRENETSDGAALKARLAAMPDDKMSALWETLKGLSDASDAPEPAEDKLIAYVRHDDGSRTPITPKQWAQAVLARPKAAPATPETGERAEPACHHHRYTQDCPQCAFAPIAEPRFTGHDYVKAKAAASPEPAPGSRVLHYPDAPIAEPPSPVALTFGGLCQCRHSTNHDLPHERGCAGYRETAANNPSSLGNVWVGETRPSPVAGEPTADMWTEACAEALRYKGERDEALAQVEALTKAVSHEQKERAWAMREWNNDVSALASANARAEALEKELPELRAFREEWAAKDGNSPGYNLDKAKSYGAKAAEHKQRADRAERDLTEARSQLASERATHEVTQTERDRLFRHYGPAPTGPASPSEPAPVAEPAQPATTVPAGVTGEVERPIVVGSTWRDKFNGVEMRVSYYDDGFDQVKIKGQIVELSLSVEQLREAYAWVSGPPLAPTEKP